MELTKQKLSAAIRTAKENNIETIVTWFDGHKVRNVECVDLEECHFENDRFYYTKNKSIHVGYIATVILRV